MKCRLSIITINLNNCSGLKKTIASVVGQRFTDYEYLIIDGASKDQSVKLLEQYSSKFAYSVSEPDTGVYQAMNKGIKKAKGEYLLFLNSGDFLEDEEVLQKVFREERKGELLLGKCNITRNGSLVHTTNPPSEITFGYLYKNGLNHQSTFIKKSLFDKYGLYREDFKYNADIEFWYRTMILNGATTEKIQVVICNYNLEGMSMRDNATKAFKDELLEIYSHPLLQKFIPDYDGWHKEQERLSVLYWVKSKKLLYSCLLLMYKMAKMLVKAKRK